MRGSFMQCLEWLMHHEGGYVDHPRDPGGATKYGVTIHTMKELGLDIDGDGDVDRDDVKLLTYQDVAPIVKLRYWDAVKGDDLPTGVDWAVADWAYNSGPSIPAKALQRIVNAKPDGMIGPKTVEAVKAKNPSDVIEALYDKREAFYKSLSTYETFGRGWSRRNRETYEQAKQLRKWA